MYIRRVVLNNIKGFADVDLTFGTAARGYAGWAAITGDNGSGKTALLRAMAFGILGPEQARGLTQDYRGWVTHGAASGQISIEISPHHEYDKTHKGGFPSDTLWAEIEMFEEAGVWDVRATDVFRHKKKGAINGPWPPSTQGWCALGYGPFRRLYGSSPDAQRLMVIQGRLPRFATLFKEDATLGEGEEWIKTLNYKKLEKNTTEERVLEKLLLLLGRDFLRFGARIEEVNSEGIWLRDSGGRRVALGDMSEGYRSALALLIDIYRHMVAVYGPDIVRERKPPEEESNFIAESSGLYYVDRPGVILIDEVDAHFHPEWQRQIGYWLTEHFPNVQFIVTTHSPLVCQAVTKGRVYHLPAGQQEIPFQLAEGEVERIAASKPDDILLTPAFGLENTRSPYAVWSRTRHSRLVAKRMSVGELADKEKEELEQLSLFVKLG